MMLCNKKKESSISRRAMLWGFLVALNLLVMPKFTDAASLSWGVPSGDWSLPANWGGKLPTYSDSAWISNGGTASVNSSVTCGALYLSRGMASINAGQLFVAFNGGPNESAVAYVGYNDSGTISQSGGTLSIDTLGDVMLGSKAGTTGTYKLDGGLLSTYYLDVGSGGTGVFTQSAGSANVVNMFLRTGSYTLSSGTLTAHLQHIGYNNGVFTQTGGTNVFGNTGDVGFGGLELAAGYTDSHGTYNLLGGTLTAVKPQSFMQQLCVGYYGEGIFNIGDANGTGTLNEYSGTGYSMNMLVRYYSGASGTVHGWGSIGLSGSLENNGRVIADGYGVDRTLDMSQFSAVKRTIVNNGNYGWFAQNHGALLLPPVKVAAGAASCNWGQASSDVTLDLINSMHVTFSNVTSGGSLSIALLAADRSDVAPIDNGKLLDIWNITPTGGLSFDSANLAFRYDDALAASLGIPETDLRVFHFDAGMWKDVTSGLDATNNLIYADGMTSFSQYAVGVPEPSTLALLVTSMLSLLAYAWQRRKHEA